MDEMQRSMLEQHADWQTVKRLRYEIAQIEQRMAGRRMRVEEVADSSAHTLVMTLLEGVQACSTIGTTLQS